MFKGLFLQKKQQLTGCYLYEFCFKITLVLSVHIQSPIIWGKTHTQKKQLFKQKYFLTKPGRFGDR
jgi:hypothetical protein